MTTREFKRCSECQEYFDKVYSYPSLELCSTCKYESEKRLCELCGRWALPASRIEGICVDCQTKLHEFYCSNCDIFLIPTNKGTCCRCGAVIAKVPTPEEVATQLRYFVGRITPIEEEHPKLSDGILHHPIDVPSFVPAPSIHTPSSDRAIINYLSGKRGYLLLSNETIQEQESRGIPSLSGLPSSHCDGFTSVWSHLPDWKQEEMRQSSRKAETLSQMRQDVRFVIEETNRYFNDRGQESSYQRRGICPSPIVTESSFVRINSTDLFRPGTTFGYGFTSSAPLFKSEGAPVHTTTTYNSDTIRSGSCFAPTFSGFKVPGHSCFMGK